jgi:hypothetical protein
MASGNDQTIHEIFADNDSENEDEFEGFDPEDIYIDLNNENGRTDLFDSEKWGVGSRQDQEPLTFSTVPGRRVPLPETTTVSDYFNIFIKDDDFEEIATETNRYAEQYFENNQNLGTFSRFRKWQNTCASEIKRYIALILAMGIISQSDINEYWSTDPVTSTPFFPATMSRDRFLLITSFLHLSNNDNFIPRENPGHDPLFKLGPIFKRMISRFNSAYMPHQNISLDEGMIPWRGNLSFRVYSPDKPVKYGIKAYMVSDSSNGYVSKFKLYTGKSLTGPSFNGATYDLVMDMMRGFFDKGYSLYCDNYYTSPQLFWDLFQLGTYATGTVRQNRRGIPQTLKDYQLRNRGDIFVMNNGPLECYKYLDSKPVYMLSTKHGSSLSTTSRRNRITNEIIRKPNVVTNYNKYMGGVDRSDQMISYTNNVVKSFKWWKKVFFHVLAITVLDAYILFCADHPNDNMTHKLFRKQLVSQLVSNNPTNTVNKVGRPSVAPQQLERLTAKHFISRLRGTGKKINIARLCKVCNEAEKNNVDNTIQKRKRAGHETSYECKDCNVSLCIEPCFRLYHSYQEYVLAYRRWKVCNATPDEE